MFTKPHGESLGGNGGECEWGGIGGCG